LASIVGLRGIVEYRLPDANYMNMIVINGILVDAFIKGEGRTL
jgi:hypothetical protein